MVILTFLLIGVAGALIQALCTSAFSAYTVLTFLLSVIAACFCFAAMFFAASLTVDKSKPISKYSKFCEFLAVTVAGIITQFCRCRIDAEGVELIPQNERFVFISNHISAFDPLCVMYKLRKYNISFVTKPSLMNMPIISRVPHAIGFLPIDRENDRNALKTILCAADYIKKDYCSIGIYPEGTRGKTNNLLPFHAGSFKIAQRAGVPVVISCIEGADKIRKNYLVKFTDVKIHILEVIPAEKVKEMTTVQLAEYSRGLITDFFAKQKGENDE